MTTALPNLIELAKKGDATSIAALMNRQLQPKGITAKAALKNDCLQVVFEAAQVPDQEVLIAFTEKGIKGLKIASVQKVKVYGRQVDEDFPEWQQEISLEQSDLPSILPETAVGEKPVDEQLPQPTSPSRLALAKSGDVGSIAEVLSYFFKEQNIQVAASLKNGCLCIVLQSETTPDQESTIACIRKVLDQLESQSWTKVKIDGWRKGATFRAWHQEISLNAPASEAFSFFGAITKTVQDTGAGLLSVTSQAGQAIGVAGNAALQATDGAGYMLDVVNQSPQLQTLTKALKVDWLLKIIDQVDIIKAEAQVKQLQKKYPHEQPGEIAHRLIVDKALYVGGTGFASSLVPGFAAPMFAVDIVATTAIQAELGYQIACAYGLNPNEPARKGEIAALFGAALGSRAAIKAGLGLMRNIPIAGAAIGASTNAATLYVIGYAACRFYEAKLSSTAEVAIAASLAESEAYIQEAAIQQMIMDQILAHVVLAGNPGKTWQQILPELEALNFSPASTKVIAAKGTPTPLPELLDRINQDFATSLMAQCQKLAQLDGVITPTEAATIQEIAQKLATDTDFVEQLQQAETPSCSQNNLFSFMQKISLTP